MKGKNNNPDHGHKQDGGQSAEPSHKLKHAIPASSDLCSRGVTFEGDGDGRALSHQVATGQELGRLGGVAALDFPDAIAEDTVRAQP